MAKEIHAEGRRVLRPRDTVHRTPGWWGYKDALWNTEMVAVRDQTGGVTANLQDVRTVTTEDNSTRHAAVAHPDTHSFHRAVSAIAVLAQCFALLPVHGVTASSAQGLRFRWASVRVAYTVTVLICLLFMVLFCSLYSFQNGRSFQESQCIMFYGVAAATYVLFLRLARGWPQLLLQWSALEQTQRCYGTPRYLRCKIRGVTAALLFGAAVEHLLSYYNNVQSAAKHANPPSIVLRQYMLRSHQHVFQYLGYSHAWAALATIVLLMATFAWNFVDLFVVITGIALTERFRLLNRHLQTARGKTLSEQFWKQTRENYTSLTHLIETANHYISHIVLLSFASNLYFICLQLLNSLNGLAMWHERVYFYLSFGFLLARIVTVSFSVASINDESLLLTSVLIAVPTDGYNMEVSRFLQLVTTSQVALTGLNFFSVTRPMLLAIAGVIATYEILLVQFSHMSK